MCRRDCSLEGTAAGTRGTSDMCLALVSHRALDAGDLVCWRGSLWVRVSVASIGSHAACTHPKVALEVLSLVGSEVDTAPPAAIIWRTCLQRARGILQHLPPCTGGVRA